jgi:hypothetical protein
MIVVTDITNFIISTILSQLGDGKLRSIAVDFNNMDKYKITYDIHDKEILTIITTLKE